MDLHAPENMTKQELLGFYNDLSFEILSLGIDRQVDLCAPNDFWGKVVSVYRGTDYFLVEEKIINRIRLVVKTVFQKLAY